MHQNDVSFAKIRSQRIKLWQLTCFRCTVNVAVEIVNQFAFDVWNHNTFSSITQCVIDEILQIKRHFEALNELFKTTLWLHSSLLRCKSYEAAKFRRSTKFAAEPWVSDWILPNLTTELCRIRRSNEFRCSKFFRFHFRKLLSRLRNEPLRFFWKIFGRRLFNDKINETIKKHHDELLQNYSNVNKTLQFLRQNCQFFNIRQHVETYIKQCHNRQKN